MASINAIVITGDNGVGNEVDFSINGAVTASLDFNEIFSHVDTIDCCSDKKK